MTAESRARLKYCRIQNFLKSLYQAFPFEFKVLQPLFWSLRNSFYRDSPDNSS